MEPPSKVPKLEKSPEVASYDDIASDEEITEKDLPLLANVDDVRVHHYLIRMKTDFRKRIVTGTMILFLEWDELTKNLASPQNKIILDTCYLNIKQVCKLKSVSEYKVLEKFHEFDNSGYRKRFYEWDQHDWFALTEGGHKDKLEFTMDKWSLTITGWRDDLPSVILIDYGTKPNSPSLDWRPSNGYKYDASDLPNVCVYTPATPVNNRGLFPCQEPPSALATWEVLMEVETELTPLLTSDSPGEIIEEGDFTKTHYFYTSVPLPMSNFAVVIGNFTLQTELKMPDHMSSVNKNTEEVSVCPSVCDKHIQYPCRFQSLKDAQEKFLPVRLFSLDILSISSLNLEKFSEFVHVSMKTCHGHFGPHPFPRLDLVIMPSSYPHMGLASPSMVFLSPSNFTGEEEPLFVCRIPHEICHSWFGLLIGALDWTEEWLSEGFCTYCEDIVFLETYQNYFPHKSKDEVLKEHALKIRLRFITLQNELRNTDNELHVMSMESDNPQNAKNGLEPIMQFMHVHYYKGYLLLCHMGSLVGHQNFTRFLKQYVHAYHAQLVTSDIFLQFYYDKFKTELEANSEFVSLKNLKEDWLESNKLPAPLGTLDLLDMDLPSELIPCTYLQTLAIPSGVICGPIISPNWSADELQRLSHTERIFFQEHLLRQMETDKKTAKKIYESIKQSLILHVETQNPDVLHRWCELIILCRDKGNLHIVENFLQRHMAMGVYLYGELMITEKRSFQKLAKRVFHKLEGVYDLGSLRVLKEMLF